MARAIGETFDMQQEYATYPYLVNATYSGIFLPRYPHGVTNPSKHTPSEKEAIGERLASARTLAGFTQAEAAAKLGITKGGLSAWETGRNLPDALMVKKLAKAYGYSADSLLWDDSLTPEAMKFAAEFDSLTDGARRSFQAMWKAYYAEAATDERVESNIKTTVRQLEDRSHPIDRLVRGRSAFGELDEAESSE